MALLFSPLSHPLPVVGRKLSISPTDSRKVKVIISVMTKHVHMTR